MSSRKRARSDRSPAQARGEVLAGDLNTHIDDLEAGAWLDLRRAGCDIESLQLEVGYGSYCFALPHRFELAFHFGEARLVWRNSDGGDAKIKLLHNSAVIKVMWPRLT